MRLYGRALAALGGCGSAPSSGRRIRRRLPPSPAAAPAPRAGRSVGGTLSGAGVIECLPSKLYDRTVWRIHHISHQPSLGDKTVSARFDRLVEVMGRDGTRARCHKIARARRHTTTKGDRP